MFPPVHISRSLVILPFSAYVVRRAVTLPRVISWTSLVSFGPHTRRPMSECSALQHTPRRIHHTTTIGQHECTGKRQARTSISKKTCIVFRTTSKKLCFALACVAACTRFCTASRSGGGGMPTDRKSGLDVLWFSPDSTNPGRAWIAHVAQNHLNQCVSFRCPS